MRLASKYVQLAIQPYLQLGQSSLALPRDYKQEEQSCYKL